MIKNSQENRNKITIEQILEGLDNRIDNQLDIFLKLVKQGDVCNASKCFEEIQNIIKEKVKMNDVAARTLLFLGKNA